jgi:anti-sigma regulatory factor (Ser/Thr protein kinase)
MNSPLHNKKQEVPPASTGSQTTLELQATAHSLQNDQFTRKNQSNLLVHLGTMTIEPSKSGYSISGPIHEKVEVSTLFDSAGLGTVYPVMCGLKQCCELLPFEQKEALLVTLEQRNDQYALPFRNGENIGIVVRELLVNAQRAIETKGSTGQVSIDLALQDDSVVITISDNGVGLPQSVNTNRLFREGFTTKDVPTHSKHLVGNGLYRSKEFVERICTGELTLGNRCTESGEVVGASAMLRIPFHSQST